MQDYEGKYIWIVGASSGIGSELALELSKRGATLALSARRADKLEQIKAECVGDNHITSPLDAGDAQSVKNSFEAIKDFRPIRFTIDVDAY